jgi:hypothetical protein
VAVELCPHLDPISVTILLFQAIAICLGLVHMENVITSFLTTDATDFPGKKASYLCYLCNLWFLPFNESGSSVRLGSPQLTSSAVHSKTSQAIRIVLNFACEIQSRFNRAGLIKFSNSPDR